MGRWFEPSSGHMTKETKTKKPVWFLDVDGVLNAFPLPADKGKYKKGKATPFYSDADYSGYTPKYTIQFDPTLIARIKALHEEGVVEVVWLTTWGYGANFSLRTLLRLPKFRSAGEMDEPELLGTKWWKSEALKRFVEAEGVERYVWTDDHLGWYLSEEEYNAVVPQEGLAIKTNEITGLTHEELDRIEEFLRA